MSTPKWDKNKREGQAAAKVTLGGFRYDSSDVLAPWVGDGLGAQAHLAMSWQQLAQGHCQQVLL